MTSTQVSPQFRKILDKTSRRGFELAEKGCLFSRVWQGSAFKTSISSKYEQIFFTEVKSSI